MILFWFTYLGLLVRLCLRRRESVQLGCSGRSAGSGLRGPGRSSIVGGTLFCLVSMYVVDLVRWRYDGIRNVNLGRLAKWSFKAQSRLLRSGGVVSWTQ